MLRVRQIKIEVTKNNKENLYKAVSKKLKIDFNLIEKIDIYKQSLDARNKNEIYYVYEVDVLVKNEDKIKKDKDIFISPNMEYKFKSTGDKKISSPIVVGMGPCGLFCAYLLALNNYKPIIIDRGEAVDERVKTVSKFWEDGILNEESNVQFGEGGAGTFSDGKLNTLVKDENNRFRFVYETFVKFGAPKEILYSYRPHIGTDILVNVVKNMREKIKELGGTFLYNSKLTNVIIENNNLKQVQINDKVIDCEVLVLAIGHSSRDTFKMLYDNNLNMESKPFALGIRVEHSQDMINESQYGKKYKDILPPASYKLTYKASNNRGVYSFCMCPGGYVVNASSEKNHLAINGMSYSKRDSDNANSAIIVTVKPEDYGNHPLSGIEFQRNLEKKAYELGNGNIPIQLLKDFNNNVSSSKLGKIKPIFKGNYTLTNINDILPKEVSNSLKEAFVSFGQKIKGFDDNDTILAAIESRTSSPVRILRNEHFESNIKGIYPSGEGAGYAGGITSAAIDGLKVAEAICSLYKV